MSRSRWAEVAETIKLLVGALTDCGTVVLKLQAPPFLRKEIWFKSLIYSFLFSFPPLFYPFQSLSFIVCQVIFKELRNRIVFYKDGCIFSSVFTLYKGCEFQLPFYGSASPFWYSFTNLLKSGSMLSLYLVVFINWLFISVKEECTVSIYKISYGYNTWWGLKVFTIYIYCQ